MLANKIKLCEQRKYSGLPIKQDKIDKNVLGTN